MLMTANHKYDIGDLVHIYYSKYSSEPVQQKAIIIGINVRKDKKENITIEYRLAPKEGGIITLPEDDVHGFIEYKTR